MIPVEPAPEPEKFDRQVRRKGQAWLREKGWNPGEAPPEVSKLPAYWTAFTETLFEAYSGICAYYAFYIEASSGAATTDHFVAKTSHAGLAYEWSNYRFASLAANRAKRDYDDVIDPFVLEPGTFLLNLASGAVSCATSVSPSDALLVEATINRLKLNSPRLQKMRASHFTMYLRGHCGLDYLARTSPFVYQELLRQGVERPDNMGC